ncbi:MAG: LiaF domain-containing protein [Acidobacteriota bacterium]
MSTEQRTNFVSIAAGLCFVGFGVLLLLQTNGLLELRTIVKLWPVALIVVGGAVVVQAMRGGEGLRGVPVGGLIWIVLLGILFSYTFDRRTAAESAPKDQINVFAVLGGDSRPPVIGEFHGGRMTTVMGGSNLDLRQSTLAPGQTAVIDVFAVMGGSQIRVPADWQVDSETIAIMGGVNTDRPKTSDKDKKNDRDATGSFASDPAPPTAPAVNPPHLLLRGTVIMGGVTVKR